MKMFLLSALAMLGIATQSLAEAVVVPEEQAIAYWDLSGMLPIGVSDDERVITINLSEALTRDEVSVTVTFDDGTGTENSPVTATIAEDGKSVTVVAKDVTVGEGASSLKITEVTADDDALNTITSVTYPGEDVEIEAADTEVTLEGVYVYLQDVEGLWNETLPYLLADNITFEIVYSDATAVGQYGINDASWAWEGQAISELVSGEEATLDEGTTLTITSDAINALWGENGAFASMSTGGACQKAYFNTYNNGDIVSASYKIGESEATPLTVSHQVKVDLSDVIAYPDETITILDGAPWVDNAGGLFTTDGIVWNFDSDGKVTDYNCVASTTLNTLLTANEGKAAASTLSVEFTYDASYEDALVTYGTLVSAEPVYVGTGKFILDDYALAALRGDADYKTVALSEGTVTTTFTTFSDDFELIVSTTGATLTVSYTYTDGKGTDEEDTVEGTARNISYNGSGMTAEAIITAAGLGSLEDLYITGLTVVSTEELEVSYTVTTTTEEVEIGSGDETTFSGSYTMSDGSWWTQYALDILELCGTVDPEDVTYITFECKDASGNAVTSSVGAQLGFNDVKGNSWVNPVFDGKAINITIIDFSDNYYLAYCLCNANNTEYTLSWTVYTTSAPEGTEFLGIEEVKAADVEAVEVARYNLMGQKISGAQKGINIIVYSDGSSKKVLVK